MAHGSQKFPLGLVRQFRFVLGFPQTCLSSPQAILSDKKAAAETDEGAHPNDRRRYWIVVRDAAQQSHCEPRVEQRKDLLKGCLTCLGDSNSSARFLAAPARRDYKRNDHNRTPNQIVP